LHDALEQWSKQGGGHRRDKCSIGVHGQYGVDDHRACLASRLAIEQKRQRSTDTRGEKELRIARNRGEERRCCFRVVMQPETRDSCDGLRANVARVERQHTNRRFPRGGGIAGAKERLHECLMRCPVLRRELCRFGPSGNRIRQATELPEHFSQMKASIDALGRLANRASKAQHRVDGSPAKLMIPSAREPLG
jgi:hypothetical protein